MVNKQPDICFSTLPGTGELICILRGETGYYPSDWNTDSAEKNREIADFQNRRMGIPYAVECAYLTASMTNWSVPGADPQFHLDHAQLVQSWSFDGHIKDDVMTVYYPAHGTLYQYKVDGREQLYCSLDALAATFYSLDRKLTVLPDLVCGRPLIQVEANKAQNGTYTLHILPHCRGYGEQEINAGYRIDTRMQVGGQEIVMGRHEKAPAQFVTWLRTPANDKNGPHNFYWGHYLDKRESGISDFRDRAHLEYQQLMERNQHKALRRRTEPER